MSKSVKEDIIDVAIELFNKNGYNGVSMRNIADSLGISVGNVTYHFNKKVDLIEASLIKQHERYEKGGKKPENLKELNVFLKTVLNHQKEDGYYYSSHKQLEKISTIGYEIQTDILKHLIEELFLAFRYLVREGILKEKDDYRDYHYSVQVIIVLCFYDIPRIKKLTPNEIVRERQRAIWSVITPNLTDKGFKEFKREVRSEIYSNKFKNNIST